MDSICMYLHHKSRRLFGSDVTILLSVLLLLLHQQTVTGKVEPGHIYSFRAIDGHCLTANAQDYRSTIGVFLGQVSTEVCQEWNKSQKWGVILWTASRNHLWLYPRENGLNAITAIPDPEEPLPEKNLVEIIPLENSNEDKFLIRSVELNQCVLSRGKMNSITYEKCNTRIKEQQWTTLSSPDEPVISDRSAFATIRDFVQYTKAKLVST